MKFYTKTFGCQMNFADSDEMGDHLKARGFTATENLDEAQAVLVNSCTIRDLAEHKAGSYLGRLRDWKLAQPERLIIFTGCAAERAKEKFRQRFPHVDLIVGAKDIDKFPDELDSLLKQNAILEEELMPTAPVIGNGNGLAPAIIQYVTIMRGCNYNCTYCIVPSVRGRESYRPPKDILEEIRRRTSEGGKEIWLLGQTVNSYKPTLAPRDDYDFSDLLLDASQIPGVERLRFMSPHPYYLTPKLIETMASTKKICEHIHLPVQSGSDDVLKRMKRNYTRAIYLRGIESLRARIPSIAISTDLIVGFPGETKQDFKETLSLVKEADFDSAYCFKYSARPGTPSAEWEDNVSPTEKEERVNQLLEIVDGKGAEKVKKLIGTVQEVLIEEEKGNGMVRGKTRTAWRVRLKNSELKPGQVIQARITATHSRELHAEIA